ncbi:MAG: heparinase II/III family protein [Planctomycetia bacterium]|nr:heparinase II/III family protein [Planctomycetia bacterium]
MSNQVFRSAFLLALSGLLLTLDACGAEHEATPAHNDFVAVEREQVVDALANKSNSALLLVDDDAIECARHKIDSDPKWKLYYDALKLNAEDSSNKPPVERQLTGRRLLSVSREALSRISKWSFLYRMTGQEQYAKRVETEMVAIANFENWNPSHFLDVAEMTVAMAIGYDVCKEQFSKDNRDLIYESIRDKGVQEAYNFKRGWKRNTANWNQVCWCGALYGALALYDDAQSDGDKELLIDVITEAVNGVTWSMSSYEPDGNYTEGPGYWAYGTGFNTLLLDALRSYFGQDFGRSDSKGFLASINYFEHVFGATGLAYNYPDSGGGKMFEPVAFWYERKFNDPQLLFNEYTLLNQAYFWQTDKSKLESQFGVRSYSSLVRDRLAVCALVWGAQADASNNGPRVTPKELGYIGIGNQECCVALFRTRWTSDAAYLGIKCGAPRSPHGHLDEGGFVYDDRGVRWICELGPESYHSIESRGMNLWAMNQNSDRWKILRYNNYGHSVPTINDAPQLVDGRASFIETQIGDAQKPSFAYIDLTPVYRNDLKKATRRATLMPNGDLIIEDCFETFQDKGAKVERRFIASANAETIDGGVLLTQKTPGTENLLFKTVTTDASTPVQWSVAPCQSDKEFDSPNPGVMTLLETSELAPNASATYRTVFKSVDERP